MKRFKTHMIEARMAKKNAVWVIGGAASGKSTVAETALVKGLKFTLIDVDVPFERLLKKFNVSSEIKKVSAEDKKKREAEKNHHREEKQDRPAVVAVVPSDQKIDRSRQDQEDHAQEVDHEPVVVRPDEPFELADDP